MERLIKGYQQFRSDVWPAERARYERLATKGQSPQTLVVACIDSRVDPQTVFGAVPGEIAVVRNVAGLVPPYEPDLRYHGTSAALEFAVRVLKVANIVVLGHAQCGGIKVMVEGAPKEARDFVEPWMAMAEPVLQRIPPQLGSAERLTQCEMEAVRFSLANLRTFPWIDDAVNEGRLALHGCRFDIHTGVLARLAGDAFVPVA